MPAADLFALSDSSTAVKPGRLRAASGRAASYAGVAGTVADASRAGARHCVLMMCSYDDDLFVAGGAELELGLLPSTVEDDA